jgi:hypothetical protein
MITLLAHHLEVQHFPVLVCIFAAGFFVGWAVVRKKEKVESKK